jgi:hypothetical protein
MDLRNELSGRQSRENCDKIVSWIGNNDLRFDSLMKLFFEGEYRLTQHAAWPVSYCVHNHPGFAKPYMKKFIELLKDSESHPAVRRNIVRLLQYTEIPKKFQGQLMDLCFQFVQSPVEAIAVKAFALHILENMSENYPEILPELRAIIHSKWESESPAFRSRARKILKKT